MNKQLLTLSLFVLFSLFVSSCSPIQTSLAPVVNSKGEMITIKPHGFTVSPKTKPSQSMKLVEDVIDPIPSNFLLDLLKLDPAKDEKALSTLILTPGQGVLKSGKTVGIIIPFIALQTKNIPQDLIDQAMPKIQRTYYRQLSKQGKAIPNSAFKSTTKKQ